MRLIFTSNSLLLINTEKNCTMVIIGIAIDKNHSVTNILFEQCPINIKNY